MRRKLVCIIVVYFKHANFKKIDSHKTKIKHMNDRKAETKCEASCYVSAGTTCTGIVICAMQMKQTTANS